MSKVRLTAEQRILRRQRTKEWKKQKKQHHKGTTLLAAFLVATELYKRRKEK